MLTKELILEQFPGTAMIPLVKAGSCIGLAKRTCYNQAHKNRFPLPIRKVGRKSMVALTDLIKYLDGDQEIKPATSKKEESSIPKRKPGRPTKAEERRQRLAALA